MSLRADAFGLNATVHVDPSAQPDGWLEATLAARSDVEDRFDEPLVWIVSAAGALFVLDRAYEGPLRSDPAISASIFGRLRRMTSALEQSLRALPLRERARL